MGQRGRRGEWTEKWDGAERKKRRIGGWIEERDGAERKERRMGGWDKAIRIFGQWTPSHIRGAGPLVRDNTVRANG